VPCKYVRGLLSSFSSRSGHALTLYFADFETITLFLSVLLVNTLIMLVFPDNEQVLLIDAFLQGRKVALHGRINVSNPPNVLIVMR
jgi:hypothetical protein